jgi:hypothetical protein
VNDFRSQASYLIQSELYGGPTLNLASANKHVPEIERKIRVIKERVRAVRYSVPCNALPALVMTHSVLFVTKQLNLFPVFASRIKGEHSADADKQGNSIGKAGKAGKGCKEPAGCAKAYRLFTEDGGCLIGDHINDDDCYYFLGGCSLRRSVPGQSNLSTVCPASRQLVCSGGGRHLSWNRVGVFFLFQLFIDVVPNKEVISNLGHCIFSLMWCPTRR